MLQLVAVRGWGLLRWAHRVLLPTACHHHHRSSSRSLGLRHQQYTCALKVHPKMCWCCCQTVTQHTTASGVTKGLRLLLMGMLSGCGKQFCQRRQTSAAPPNGRHTPAEQDVSHQRQWFGPLSSRWSVLYAPAACRGCSFINARKSLSYICIRILASWCPIWLASSLYTCTCTYASLDMPSSWVDVLWKCQQPGCVRLIAVAVFASQRPSVSWHKYALAVAPCSRLFLAWQAG